MSGLITCFLNSVFLSIAALNHAYVLFFFITCTLAHSHALYLFLLLLCMPLHVPMHGIYFFFHYACPCTFSCPFFCLVQVFFFLYILFLPMPFHVSMPFSLFMHFALTEAVWYQVIRTTWQSFVNIPWWVSLLLHRSSLLHIINREDHISLACVLIYFAFLSE